MNDIMQLILDSKYNKKIEQILIQLYNDRSLPLHLVPHRFRNNGFFYEECIRKHQYDLIPNLSSEEIKTLKSNYFEKANQLNRVDSSAFNIKRVKTDLNYLRAYLYQLINDCFTLSDISKKEFEKRNKKIEELSENEILEILQHSYQDLNPCFELYHFDHENEIDINDFTNYPELFTDIKEVSYDQGGLVVLELYGEQIYKLFTSKGKFITGPCHDLNILINGKYRERDSGNTPGFHLSKYSVLEDSILYLDSFADFGGEAYEFLEVIDRDRLQIEIGTSKPERIENFIEPKSKDDAKSILLDSKCNWITSPELTKFYEDDKELAKLAISKEPLAFSLLSDTLRKDKSIQKTLCLYPGINFNLLNYIKEWDISIENILNLEQLTHVFKNNVDLFRVCADKTPFNSNCKIAENRDIVLEVVRSKGQALEYASKLLKADREIVLEAVKKNGLALKYASESLKADRELVKESVKNNGWPLQNAKEPLNVDKDILDLDENSGEVGDLDDLPF
jgi:hypothetical protein